MGKLDRWTVWYATWLLRHRWLVLLAVLLGVIATGTGLFRLSITDSYRVYFGPTNPDLVAMDELQNTFARDENLFIALAPAEGTVFTREGLAAIHELTEAAWQIPYTVRVNSLTNFQHSYGVGDELIVEELVANPAALTAEALEAVRTRALNDPMLVNGLVAESGDAAGVSVRLDLPPGDQDAVGNAVDAAYALTRVIQEKYTGYRVHVAGTVLTALEIKRGIEHDLLVLMPLQLMVSFVVMMLLLRSVGGALATLALVGCSTAVAMGAMGWHGAILTPPSAISPVLILTLAVADCVHLLVTFYSKLGRGIDRNRAMVESIRINFSAVLLTSVTTAIGFLSLNFSDSPPFRDLGTFTAIGAVAAFVFSLTLLPIAMTALPARPRVHAQERSTTVEKLSEWVVRRQGLVLIASAAITVLVVPFVARNELNEEFTKYFDKDLPLRQSINFINEDLTGTYRFEYALDAGESGGVANPSYLRNLDGFTQWLRQRPDVVHVESFTDIMKRLNMNMHGQAPEEYRLPADRETAAQYLLLYELSLPQGLDLNDRVNIDRSATRLSVAFHEMSSSQCREKLAEIAAWMGANLPAHMQARGVSQNVMFAFMSLRQIQSMVLGTTVALVLISAILVFAMRSVNIGLLSLVPNLLPLMLGFGIWGMVVGEIGMSASIVAAMSIGIVVDDTVHFLSKYLRGRREENLPPEGAVRYAFGTVGRALIVTTIMLVAGFLVLTLSAYNPTRVMGWLMVLILTSALLADLFLLPALLLRVDRARSIGKLELVEEV